MNSFIAFLIVIVGAFILRILLQKVRQVSGQKTKIIIVLYLGVLFIAFPVSFLLPNKTEDNPKNAQERKLAENASILLDTAIQNGNFSEIENFTEKKTWSFTYEKDQITLNYPNMDHSLQVVVDRKQTNENTIDITYYTTPYMIEDYDYTHLIRKPEIKLIDDSLLITNPNSEVDLEFKGFHKEIPIVQFTEEKMQDGFFHVRGRDALYLKVPEHLKISTAKGIYLQFVEN